MAYSIVALQEANLAYKYPMVYWNCANLISDSGGESSTVNYGKIATALSRVRKEGVHIVPPYINESRFDFRPDSKNNQIVYGLKPVNGIGSSQANAILQNQPYTSLNNFIEKMEDVKSKSKEHDEKFTFGKAAILQLIKAGAFDEVEHRSRQEIMKDYIWSISKPLTSLSAKNIEEINSLGLLTEKQKKNELRWIRFKNYIFVPENVSIKPGKSATTWFYKLEERYAAPYFMSIFADSLEEGKDYKYDDLGNLVVKRGSFDKTLDDMLDNLKVTVFDNKEVLDKVNQQKFDILWEENASGSISKWEMDSLNYYYHDHELLNVDRYRYDIRNFDEQSPDPVVKNYFSSGKQVRTRYMLYSICGTVIDKDNMHNTITLLTPDGVVTVKFYKGQYNYYAQDIVDIRPDGKKVSRDPSWFSRGTKLLITGYRNEENFIPKVYTDSIFRHSVQLIKDVNKDGTLLLQLDRNEGEDAGKTAIAI